MTRAKWPIACLAALAALISLPASAQLPDSDRLFLSFIEDPAIVTTQWWEGQLEFANGEDVDARILRGVVAAQPWTNIEVGGRVGFGSTDAPTGIPDGSGATDLEVWGKWRFAPESASQAFAIGGTITVPTGDDAVGLGNDAFSASFFGAARLRLGVSKMLVFNAGLRTTGDGQMFGVDIDGKSSMFAAGAVLIPVSNKVTFVGEARFENRRFSGGDKDTRVLGGVNWRVLNRGMLRGAIAVALSDGQPDAQVIAAYAYQF
jgi:hypothetical protein